jgi:ATP-dependent Clp protease ATP-binding subunit ClpC
MFERYTSAARRVLSFARHEGIQAGAASIGTEHLLLSLLRISPGLFGQMSQDEAAIRNELLGSTEAPEAYGTDLPLSSAARRAMSYAAEEADMLGHPQIGTEHLLMGLMHDPDAPLTLLLGRYGIGREQMRQELAAGKPLEPDVPPSRKILHAIVDELPENSLAPALRCSRI